MRKGPIRGSSGRRSTDVPRGPTPEHLNRAKAIAIASAAVAAAAIEANGANAASLRRVRP